MNAELGIDDLANDEFALATSDYERLQGHVKEIGVRAQDIKEDVGVHRRDSPSPHHLDVFVDGRVAEVLKTLAAVSIHLWTKFLGELDALAVGITSRPHSGIGRQDAKGLRLRSSARRWAPSPRWHDTTFLIR